MRDHLVSLNRSIPSFLSWWSPRRRFFLASMVYFFLLYSDLPVGPAAIAACIVWYMLPSEYSVPSSIFRRRSKLIDTINALLVSYPILTREQADNAAENVIHEYTSLTGIDTGNYDDDDDDDDD
jgi:hypothetical protein